MMITVLASSSASLLRLMDSIHESPDVCEIWRSYGTHPYEGDAGEMNQILWTYHMEKRKPLVKMDCNSITACQHYRFGLVILNKLTFGIPESAPRQIHLDDGGQSSLPPGLPYPKRLLDWVGTPGVRPYNRGAHQNGSFLKK